STIISQSGQCPQVAQGSRRTLPFELVIADHGSRLPVGLFRSGRVLPSIQAARHDSTGIPAAASFATAVRNLAHLRFGAFSQFIVVLEDSPSRTCIVMELVEGETHCRSG